MNRYEAIQIPQGVVTLHETIGQGHFSQVYSGTLHRPFRRDRGVAVKRYNLPLTDMGKRQYEGASDEATILNSLGLHPRILSWSEQRTAGGRSVDVVMEQIQGISLKERIIQDRISPMQAVEIMIPILDTLAKAHAHNPPVIHMDVHPGNILIPKKGRATLVDWNSARPLIDRSQITTGEIVFRYGPPECETFDREIKKRGMTNLPIRESAMGEELIGTHTDIYQAGITLFNMLARNLDYTYDPELVRLCMEIRDVPERLQQIVVDAISRDPFKRPSALEMKRALEAWIIEYKAMHPTVYHFGPLVVTVSK